MSFGPEEEKTTDAFETFGKWTFFITAGQEGGGIVTYSAVKLNGQTIRNPRGLNFSSFLS